MKTFYDDAATALVSITFCVASVSILVAVFAGAV
jgi:hypothetical protein